MNTLLIAFSTRLRGAMGEVVSHEVAPSLLTIYPCLAVKLPLLAGALILTLQSTAGDCASCVPGKRQAKLCEPHASEEQVALKVCVAALRADEPEARIVALRALAALTEVHANAPSPVLVKTLARGLKDSSNAVRLETVKLLGGQHPEAALTALVPFVKAHVKRVKKANERQDELSFDRRLRGLKNHGEDWSKRNQADYEKYAAEQEAIGEEQAALRQITDALAVDLAQYQDGRSVSALEALAEYGSGLKLVDALATLGNVEAAEILVGRLHLEVRMWVLVQGWVDKFPEEMDVGPSNKVAETLKKAAEGLKHLVETVHAGLQRIARAAGHEQGLPEYGLESLGEQWQAWLKRHRKSLPRNLGRMAMPWDQG